MTKFFKSLTLREMLLWSVAFSIGLVAGYFGLLVSAYVVGVSAAIFVSFRYIVPDEQGDL